MKTVIVQNIIGDFRDQATTIESCIREAMSFSMGKQQKKLLEHALKRASELRVDSQNKVIELSKVLEAEISEHNRTVNK